MNRDPVKPSSNPRSNSTDSLLGMALAQAFTGFAFGPAFEQVWEAGEVVSAVYKDRFESKRANGSDKFELGVKQSLAGAFTRNSESQAEKDRAAFRPFFGQSRDFSPAFA